MQGNGRSRVDFDESISLPPVAASARAAREFVTDFVLKIGRSDLEDVAKLCASELVTNVLQHTDGRHCALRVAREGTHIVVEVSDDSSTAPLLMPAGLSVGHCWGLQLIDALASDWGIHSHPDGKSVWLRLD
jgi:hypothetical protein